MSPLELGVSTTIVSDFFLTLGLMCITSFNVVPSIASYQPGIIYVLPPNFVIHGGKTCLCVYLCNLTITDGPNPSGFKL